MLAPPRPQLLFPDYRPFFDLKIDGTNNSTTAGSWKGVHNFTAPAFAGLNIYDTDTSKWDDAAAGGGKVLPWYRVRMCLAAPGGCSSAATTILSPPMQPFAQLTGALG